ncbi:uncharacterized protein LOC135393552 isoform X2 [Ornithodoros turicata]|uniref:uncharacterized protein LOC135393552 isoform X2 n=1 Tax=Ornithodoros turicata TaxID=34597 RepID=UPI003139219C
MLRVYVALFVTLGILSSAFPGSVRATSDELSPDASSTTPGQTNSTIPISYASVKISKRRRSITSSYSNDTVHKIRGSDGSSALRRAQVLSPQMVSQTLLKMMETLEKMSQRAERLSDDVKELRTASQTSIDRQGLVLNEVREEVDTLERRTYSRVVEIGQSITNLERYIKMKKFHRKAVFNVENIRQQMEKTNVSARAQNVESDLFLLDGYTAKIRVKSKFEKNKVWLSVYLCFCSGSKDSLLQWPFRDDYTLSIFHPSSSAKDVNNKVTASAPSACAGNFDKPTAAGCNNCCGSRNGLSRESAEEGGYIYNGAITVGVTLH